MGRSDWVRELMRYGADPDQPDKRTTPTDQSKFIAAKAFTGPMAGYSFKAGKKGLGYYNVFRTWACL